MNRSFAGFLCAATGAGLLFIASAASGEDKGVDWKSLSGAKVSLEKGLTAAQRKGRPISGKFEIEDDKLQLSVYTASKGAFHEVIVDHVSGKIAKSEQIKEGEDYIHANAQIKAMSAAKKSLRAAVAGAVAANPGYRAVSAIPSVEQGKPVATVVLQNEAGTKTVSEKLY